MSEEQSWSNFDHNEAEFLDRLSKAARHRFDSRRTIEWQICFGLWTALAVGSGLVINADSWYPSWMEVIGSSIFVATLCIVFGQWAVARHENDQVDMQTAYYWETDLIRVLGRGEEFPRELLRSDWRDAITPGAPRVQKKNKSPVFQLAVTVTFGLLLIGTVASKAGSSGTEGLVPSNGVTEGAEPEAARPG